MAIDRDVFRSFAGNVEQALREEGLPVAQRESLKAPTTELFAPNDGEDDVENSRTKESARSRAAKYPTG